MLPPNDRSLACRQVTEPYRLQTQTHLSVLSYLNNGHNNWNRRELTRRRWLIEAWIAAYAQPRQRQHWHAAAGEKQQESSLSKNRLRHATKHCCSSCEDFMFTSLDRISTTQLFLSLVPALLPSRLEIKDRHQIHQIFNLHGQTGEGEAYLVEHNFTKSRVRWSLDKEQGKILKKTHLSCM